MQIRTGTCACGGVRYEITGSMREVTHCHCEPCRRTSGHHVAASAIERSQVCFAASETLRWYAGTATTEYGFCSTCGSSLFWRAQDKPEHLSVMAGSLDQPTGLATTGALFVAEAGDYHRLDTSLENHDQDWEPGRTD